MDDTMSRITLTTYPDNTPHLVVGWDHPAQGAFWQEWATKQEVSDAEAELERMSNVSYPSDDPASEVAYKKMYDLEVIAETGVKREGGMWPGLSLPLRPHVPDDLKVLITDEVERLLLTHAEDADSGRIAVSLNTLKEN
jgi:hypothetical protein